MPRVEYELADDVRELAKVVFEEDQKADGWLGYIDIDAIIFIRTNRKSKRTVANMGSVKAPYHLITKALYICTIYSNKYDDLPEEKQKIVLQHELQHCDFEFDGKTRKHDVEDFKNIIDKHGLEWIQDGDDDRPKKTTEDKDDE